MASDTREKTEEASSLRALTDFVKGHVREQRELALSILVPPGEAFSQEQFAEFAVRSGAKRMVLLRRLEELCHDIWMEGYAAAADDINAIRTGTLTEEERATVLSGARLKALVVGLGLEPSEYAHLYEAKPDE